MKRCNRCNLEKSKNDFFINSKRSDGLQTYCKPCHLEYGRERYANPEAFKRRQMNRELYKERRKDSTRKWYLKSTYGISQEKYLEMLESNNNSCWICNEKRDYWLHVDHDHSCCPTDKSCGRCVRGLLCHNCNSLLGNAKDNLNILRKAIEYLDN
jgi:hypothetical protein